MQRLAFEMSNIETKQRLQIAIGKIQDARMGSDETREKVVKFLGNVLQYLESGNISPEEAERYAAGAVSILQNEQAAKQTDQPAATGV
jgi:hypothetical protein